MHCVRVPVQLYDKKTVFEISFEANQTFGLTGFEVSQTELKGGRQKTYFL